MKLILILTALIVSCTPHSTKLEEALAVSGENRTELECVIEYYSRNEADSLKLRAAKFLIENMPGHFNLYGDSVKSYIEQFDILNPNVFMYAKSYYYSLPLENEHSELLLERRYDIENITAEFLIKTIEFKFKLWDVLIWKEQLLFDEFCEYILPYRFGDEVLYDIPQTVLDDVISRLSEFKLIAGSNTTMSEAKEYLKEKVFADKDKSYFVKTPGDIPYNVRDCNAAALIYAEQNRFLGIPVTIDFIPHWGNSSGRHTWNKMIDTYDKTMVENYIIRSKIAKVYRRTYSHNNAPHGDGFVPPLFTPFIKDVTRDYIRTANVELSYKDISNKGVKNIYLSVFNDNSSLRISIILMRQ